MSRPVLYPQSDGPWWDEVPAEIPERGMPGVRAVIERDDYVAIAGYEGSGELVAVLTFGLDRSRAQPISGTWTVTRPDARRRGWATRLYALATSLGYDMEAAEEDDLVDALLTPDGYDFMVGRRAKAR